MEPHRSEHNSIIIVEALSESGLLSWSVDELGRVTSEVLDSLFVVKYFPSAGHEQTIPSSCSRFRRRPGASARVLHERPGNAGNRPPPLRLSGNLVQDWRWAAGTPHPGSFGRDAP